MHRRRTSSPGLGVTRPIADYNGRPSQNVQELLLLVYMSQSIAARKIWCWRELQGMRGKRLPSHGTENIHPRCLCVSAPTDLQLLSPWKRSISPPPLLPIVLVV